LYKLDLVAGSTDEPLSLDVLSQINITEFSRVVTTSATKGWGMTDFRDAIESEISRPKVVPTPSLPVD